MVLGFFSKILGGPKTKVFLGVILTLSLLGGLLYYQYDSVKESLILANEEIQSIAQDLQTSESTIDSLERDIQLTSELLREKEEDRQASYQLAQDLQKRLNKMVDNDENLKMCLTVDMADYINGMPVSSRKEGD